ncbi:MFS transporter [Prosthecomicrobium pneumaticum]|uniref:MFS family permease n=1 Tax=Prosthecomicrobium pneumaticum TaxID=81895 RepID=A0A7W9L3P2_9HYPH|nr:MFS family permease [Prosthecomicrobium pneumaticum]
MTALDANDRLARRNAAVLTAATAFNGSVMPIAMTIGGLAGLYLMAGEASLATAPVTAAQVGAALGAVPAAALMRRAGRRIGFMAGAAIAMIGCLLAAFGLLQGTFLLLVLGMTGAGAANAFIAQYRFAAADVGSPAQRTKAISWVMAGGVASAVIGPQAVILTRDWFAPIPFVGAFLAGAALAFVGIFVVGLLRAPAPVTPSAAEAAAAQPARPLAAIVRQPVFVVSVACAVASYALMSLVMTAAPLAMVGCGIDQDTAVLGIQWHVIAMFAPSFVTGKLILRFGKQAVVAAGLALLAGSALVSLAGLSVAHFWLGLILLGIGWNFGFVGATAMLTETYRPSEKSRVQGLNDLIVFGSVALASFSSGRLIDTAGWTTINIIVLPIVVACFAALLWGWTALGRRPGSSAG